MECERISSLNRRSYPAVIPVESNSGELVVTLDSIWGGNIMQVFLKGLTEILLKIQEKQIDRLEEDCNGYKRNDRCKL